MLEELRRHREMVQERIQKSFESDGLNVNSIIKGEETKIFKAQETEEQEASVTDLIKAGVLEYDDSIEKAVYADTAENRKLGRVGQEYHRGKGKKVEEKTGNKSVNDDNKTPEKKQQNSDDKNLFGGVLDEMRKKRQGWILSRDWKNMLGKYNEDKLKSFIESETEKMENIKKRAKDIFNSEDKYPWGGKVKNNEEKQQLVNAELKNIVDNEDLISYAKNLLSKKKVNENSVNEEGNDSSKNLNSIANFLKENASQWMDYQYGSLDDEELEKKFDEVSEYIKDIKTFDYRDKHKANAFKEKMESKGYKVVDLGEGTDTFAYAVIKNKK